MMIRFFLRFLDTAGISRDRLIFRVSIHESGDVSGAQRFWIEVAQASPLQFRQPQIKRHNPRTTRKNTGEAYRGCLRVEVRRSIELYRKIEGWALGSMTAPPADNNPGPPLEPRQPNFWLPGEDSNLG
jgi:hypothetical protein